MPAILKKMPTEASPKTLSVNPKPPAAKTAAAAVSKPAAVIERPEREVIYPTLCVNGIEIPLKSQKITVQMAKEWLGWETEKEYAARQMAADPNLKEEAAVFGPDCTFTFSDEEKNTVTCWNNLDNRPFRRDGDKSAMSYCQDILNRCWSGPSTFTGETVNGETIIIGRTGKVISGQHRLIGLVFASQLWTIQNLHWSKLWAEEPFMEGLVVTGASESDRVISTIDNVIPRDIADTTYTSSAFADMDQKSRRECSGIMAAAISLLWKRTDMKANNRWESLRTNSAALQFRDRHPRLYEFTRHLFKLNSLPDKADNRAISKLRLSPGQCAAMLYLMAVSETDPTDYKELEQPGEKNPKGRDVLIFQCQPEAEEFWNCISACHKPGSKLEAVHQALAALVDEDNPGITGRLKEKMSVICKAWAKFKNNEEVDPSDLELHYHKDADSNRQLDHDDYADFGGIDNADPKAKEEVDQKSPEQLAEDIRKAREEKAETHRREVESSERRATGEVKPAAIKFDTDGKPPTPKLLKQPLHKATPPPAAKGNGKQTQKQVNAAQTAQAAKHDAEDAAAKAAAKPAKVVDQQKLRAKTGG